VKKDEPLLSVADSILYVCSLLGDRVRQIDHYIDYFGSGAPVRRRLEPLRRAS
jgi:hypothetical protein